MNKARYGAFPPNCAPLLDAQTGLAFSKIAGDVWDEASSDVEAAVRKGGRNVISQLSDADKAAWMKACEPVTAHWIDEMKARKLDGLGMVEAAKALLARYAA